MNNFPANARITRAHGVYHFAGQATITDPGGSTNVRVDDLYTIFWGPAGLAALQAGWSGNPDEEPKIEVTAEFVGMFGTLSLNFFDMAAAAPDP